MSTAAIKRAQAILAKAKRAEAKRAEAKRHKEAKKAIRAQISKLQTKLRKK